MTSSTTEFPCIASGRIPAPVHAQMITARDRYGVTTGALVRMALTAYMPRYLAAQGRKSQPARKSQPPKPC